MSVSPSPHEPGGTKALPDIPKATGVLWPSLILGIACVITGIYLVVTTPAQLTKPRLRPLQSASPTIHSSSRPLNANNSRVLSCVFVDSKDSTFALGLERFAKEVQAKTEGKLILKLYPSGLIEGQTLDERGIIEGVRQGKIALGLTTTSPLTNYNHLLDVFDLPFLMRSYQHADTVTEGPIGQELLHCLKDKNLLGLSYMEVGFRVFSSSIPLPSYASFAGKKLRIMQSVTFSRFIKAIGGEPVPSPVDKIYAMAQKGYIDGADRTYPTYWDFRLYDVHRFITETHHAYSVKMLVVNKGIYEGLTPGEQRILKECAQEASRLQRIKQRQADDAVKATAIKEGIKVFDLSKDDRGHFVRASSELYDEYRQHESKTILDAIIKAGEP